MTVSIYDDGNSEGGISPPIDRPMDTTRRSGLSKAVKQSIPQFILDEYPLMVEFLEAYYEWMDQQGNPLEFMQNAPRYFDVDTTTAEFLEHFKSNFLYGFPKNLYVHQDKRIDETVLVKNIRQFYQIKGNEKSIQLLFKIITDSDILIEYPRELMFNISSANYVNYHKMCVLKDYANQSAGFDPTKVDGLVLNQYEGVVTVTASATMLAAYDVSEAGSEYTVFLVSNPTGRFVASSSSPVELVQNGQAFRFYLVDITSGASVVSGGAGYAVGEFLTFGSATGDRIRGFVSRTDAQGKIEAVSLFSNPVVYRGSTAFAISSPYGTGAALSLDTGPVSSSVQSYLDDKNLLGGSSRIQDSFRYQQFSYVVKSRRSLEEYLDAVRQVIHPSGFILFNELHNNIYSLRPTEYKTRAMAYERTSIGSYAGYALKLIDGGGDTGGWNPDFFGNPNPGAFWGQVFGVWSDATGAVNPSDRLSNADIPKEYRAYDAEYNDLSATGSVPFAPGITFLPNPDETQIAGVTVWIVMPHPAERKGEIPKGTSFADIKIEQMLRLPVPVIT